MKIHCIFQVGFSTILFIIFFFFCFQVLILFMAVHFKYEKKIGENPSFFAIIRKHGNLLFSFFYALAYRQENLFSWTSAREIFFHVYLKSPVFYVNNFPWLNPFEESIKQKTKTIKTLHFPLKLEFSTMKNIKSGQNKK